MGQGLKDFENRTAPEVKKKKSVVGLEAVERQLALEDPSQQGLAGIEPGPADINIPKPGRGLASFEELAAPPGLFRQPPVDRPSEGLASFESPVNPNVRQAMQDEVAGLEAQAAQEGVLSKLGHGALTVLSPLIDIISRPNYALAGAFEEIFKDDEDSFFKNFFIDANLRMAREMFSNGIIFKGDKKAFGQVFEDIGIGELGRLSNSALAGFMFTDSGEGWAFQKGGFMDFTGRGAIGLTGDIFLDPLTYLTFGTSGGAKLFLEGAKQGVKVGSRRLTAESAEQLLKKGDEIITATTRAVDTVAGREKILNRVGTRHLESTVKKQLGLTEDGIEIYRGKLFAALENKNGFLNLDNYFKQSESLIHLPKIATQELTALFHSGKDLTKIPLTDLSANALRDITQKAVIEAEQSMATSFLNALDLGNKTALKAMRWFDDGGVKFMGRTITGTPAAFSKFSEMSADGMQAINRYFIAKAGKNKAVNLTKGVLDQARWVSARWHAVTRLFRRDVAKDPVYLAAKQQMIDKDGFMRSQLAESLDRNLGDFDLNPEQWETIIDALDKGNRNINRELSIRGIVTGGGGKPTQTGFRSQFPIAEGLDAQSIARAERGRTISAIQAKLSLPEGDVNKIVKYVEESLSKMDGVEFAGWRADLMDKNGLKISKNIIDDAVRAAGVAVRKILMANNNAPIRVITIAQEVADASKLVGPQKQALGDYIYQWVSRKHISNVPMFFDNRSAQLTQGLVEIIKEDGMRAGFWEDNILGRHRAFYGSMSREETLKVSATLKQADPKFPALRPVVDLREMIRRRMDMHVEDQMGRQWEQLMKQLNVDVKNVRGSDIFRDLTRGDELTDAAKNTLREKHYLQWQKRRAELDGLAAQGVIEGINELPASVKGLFQLNTLSKAEKRQWIAWDILASDTRRKMASTMTRYAKFFEKDWDLVPKYKNLKAFRDADFTAFRKLNLKRAVTNTEVEIPTGMWDDYTNMKKNIINSRDLATIWKPWDVLNNFFKTGVTAIFPAFHFRNFYGNVAQGFTDIATGAFDPKQHYFSSMLVMRDQLRRGLKFEGVAVVGGALTGAALTDLTDQEDGFVKEVLANMAAGAAIGFTGVKGVKLFREQALRKFDAKLGNLQLVAKNGRVYTMNEVEELAKQFGVMTSGEKLFELVGEFTPFAGGKARRGFLRFQKNLREVGTVIENEARIQLFINHLRRGLKPAEAAARVKKFLFDYDNLSHVEKQFARRAIPFYTWFRKNIPLQIENLAKRPGRIAIQLDVLGAVANESEALRLYEDIDGTVLRLDRDGRNVTVLAGIDLPFTQLNYFDALLGNSRRQRELMTMLNPLLRLGPELILNQSFFTGRDLTRRESTAVGKVIEAISPSKGWRDWMGYKKDIDGMTGLPRYTFNGKKFYMLFESWAVSRMLRTSDKVFEREVLSTDNSNFIQWLLTATRTETINLDEREFQQLRIRRNALRKLLQERGAIREIPITSQAEGER